MSGQMCIRDSSQNHLLMHAVAANVSGQIASVVAGGVVLQYFANNPIL